VAIELVSGTARLFSLSFRLFANIMAGHSILQLVSFMACEAMSSAMTLLTLAVHCVQSTMLLVTWAMEAGLALLQAYVFGALLLIYAGETHPSLLHDGAFANARSLVDRRQGNSQPSDAGVGLFADALTLPVTMHR